jgi:hypothetical protein
MARHLVDWRVIGDRTCELISTCLKKRPQFEATARERRTTFESLMAAAIVEMIREEVEPEQ